MTEPHPLRCETCTKKHGTNQYPALPDSFYATNTGIMICEVDGEPIKFSSYIRTHTHGCASHSAATSVDVALTEIENGLKTYVKEHEHQQARDNKGIYIPINTVRRLIKVRREKYGSANEDENF